MSDNFSKKIVKETFENSFNKEQFTLFIKNLLNHIDDTSEGAKFVYRGQFIPEVYQESISSLERIGKYTDPEGKKIELLIVNLKKENSLDRARTLQRNFVAWYLDGSRNGVLKDAALVAFVSPNLDSWRFSLVKMDYKIQEAKVKKDLTPAKRYSFLVGLLEKSHTAQSRLIPIIDDDKNNPSLKQIEEAFNIEKVTKEFFEKYRDLFIRLKESLDDIVSKNNKIKEDFEKKNIETSGFAKKLLGQIVFLYFLQKKGWFGVERDSDWGTGPKNFLRELFDSKKITYKNFFNDILEPLFYEALAKKRDNDFYSRLNCKIPFLNGGLFDPLNDYDWVFTDIDIDNELFSNNYKTKEGDIGTGILDVFDRYNFTVREDEPLEKEVAVDPEMLGKVFENLLEVKDRKSKGTYYTPREIVHYMCQESLINYLYSELNDQVSKDDLGILVKKGISFIHNDQSASLGIKKYEEQIPPAVKKFAPLIDIKLADIKVCDPAVGSGAFLVGMMTEIVNVREVLSYLFSNVKEKDIYKFKRWSIQHSLYGVDIDPSAVEVAKLRLWLSLVVEEDDIKKIKPLPNLDYKIMQGNSLLEEFKGVKIFDEKLLTKNKVDEYDYVAELKQKELELGGKLLPFYQENPRLMSNKSLSRPAELLELETEMEKVQSSLKKNTTNLKTQIIKPLQIGLSFLGIGGREDVWLRLKKLYSRYFKSYDSDQKRQIRDTVEKVIWELIETTLKEEGKLDTLKEIEIYKNNGIRPFFLWKLYFADVFQEKGGFDVVIANPPYVKEYINKSAFDGLRKSDYYQGKMDLWYFFACVGLDLLKNDGVETFIAQNNWTTSYGASKMRGKIINQSEIITLIDFNNLKVFDTADIQTMVMIFKKNHAIQKYHFDYRKLKDGISDRDCIDNLLNKKNDGSTYISPEIIRSKLSNSKLTFNNLESSQILNKLISISNFKLDGKIEVAQGIVCPQDAVNKSSYEKLGKKYPVGTGIFILSDKEIIEQNFTTDELKIIKPLYTTKEVNRWLLKEKNKKWIIYTDSSFKKSNKIDNYPNIKNHLDKFNKVITSDNAPYGLHRSRNESFFRGDSILVARKCIKPEFSFSNKACYVSATFYVIKTERINKKFLLGLLNSKLISFWLKNKGKMQGNNYQIDKEPLLELPLYNPVDKQKTQIIKLVDSIFTTINNGEYMKEISKINSIEQELNQLVYKLYKLSEKEVEVIENQIK